MIPVSKLLKGALTVHGIYFLVYAAVFEFFLSPLSVALDLPAPDGVVAWVAVGIASGEMLTVGVLLVLAGRQKEIPRWVLAVPVVQTSFNLYHDFVWLSRGYPPLLIVIDTVLIFALCVLYLLTYKRALDTAVGLAPKLEKGKLAIEKDDD